MKGVDYSSSKMPKDYKCWDCGVSGCKLWRYSGFPPIELQCVDCVVKGQNNPKISTGFVRDAAKPGFRIDEDSTYLTDYGMRTDQIGWRLPAIPDEEGVGYWGYSSAPQVAVEWWRKLPLRSSK